MENGSGGFWEGAGPSEEDSRPASGGGSSGGGCLLRWMAGVKR